jgi:hypothetical protein
MASFYDSQSNDFATAVNGYLQGQNTIAQQQLEGAKSLVQGKEQMATATVGVKAQGMEEAIKDKLQEHLNKFADEMGLDLSVQGLGKPLLTGASKLLKAKATRMRESGASKKPGSRGDDGTDGTEMENMGKQPEPTETDLPTIRETSFMDAEPKDVTGQTSTKTEEAVRGEPEAPEAPTVAAEPEAPQVEAPEPAAPERPPLRGAEPDVDPRTQAAIERGEPVEVDAFSPSSAPLVRQQEKIPEPSEEDIEPPEQPGLAGPGEFEAPARPPVNIPEAPESLSEGISYIDESSSLANPFSLYYRGPITDVAEAPGRFLQEGAPILRGPPRAAPELPDVSFQFQAPVQPRPVTKASIDRANASEADSGGDALQPMRDELMKRRGRVQAEQQEQSGERGASEGADEFAAENQTGRGVGALADEVPPYLRPAVPRPPPQSGMPGPDELPSGGEMSDAVQQAANENINAVSSKVGDLSNQIDTQLDSARSAIEDNISDLTDQASKAVSDMSEKAAGMLGDITGSDVLGGLGSLLGLGADLLGPIMGGVGLFEAAKGIAEDQNAPDDPYAKVRALIAQNQQKMSGLESQISSDQFAEKIGANAPKFGSLAAPVFSTQSAVGGSMHF